MSVGSYFSEISISLKYNNTFFSTRRLQATPENFSGRIIGFTYIKKSFSERILFNGQYDLFTERKCLFIPGSILHSSSRILSFNSIAT